MNKLKHSTSHPLNHWLSGLCLALVCAGATQPFAAKGWAATITVTSTADGGAGTLRAALASAANGDTIDASSVTGTILLTGGELLVTNSVTIAGPGPGNLDVDGNFPNTTNRVFHIGSGTVVTIGSLTITNGHASGVFPANIGGGIYNDPGTLTVSNCTLSGNSASYGGAILNNHSTLTVNNCTLSGNSVGFSGGGIYNYGFTGSATLTVSTSTLSGNSAGYGGGIYNDGESGGNGMLTVNNSTLSGNSAYNYGGGIVNDGYRGNATLTVSASTLSGNMAGYEGGGIYNYGVSGHGMLTVSASTLSGNSAEYGGGIYNNGEVPNGGTISSSATLMIANSTLSGNTALYSGGGIVNDGFHNGYATLAIVNSTLSGNLADSGGGIYNYGYGGAAPLAIVNSTLSGNWAFSAIGGGIYIDNATLRIGSTILNAGLGSNIAFTNFVVAVVSDGYNLSSDAGGGFLTGINDQVNTNPMLGPLQDNGGPTFTHAPLCGSPAIDKGKNLSTSATDQRGSPRTFDDPRVTNATGGDGTDIGAVEVQLACTLSNVGVVSDQFGFDVTGGSNSVVVVEASTDLVSWTALATNTLSASPLHFSDPDWTNFQQRFYRAKLVP